MDAKSRQAEYETQLTEAIELIGELGVHVASEWPETSHGGLVRRAIAWLRGMTVAPERAAKCADRIDIEADYFLDAQGPEEE